MKQLCMWIAVMLISSNAMAFGEAGRWSKGWGQGATEYTAVVDENNSLYISCNGFKKVFMMATVDGVEYGESSGSKGAFALNVDGDSFNAPYETDSRAGSDAFYIMWFKLRAADSIFLRTADGKVLSLPLKDADKVLPNTDTPEFNDCLMADKSEEPAPVQAPAPKPAPAQEPEPTPATVTTPLPSSTFDVSWNWDEFMPNVPMKVLQVVSHSDKITIQQAIVNRGQCTSSPHGRLPLTLGFGGTAKFIIPQNCNILELRLLTNQGEAQYQFTPQS